MASEKAANLARARYAESLRRLGAHAIAVDTVRRQGKKTFGVVAYFERKPSGVPRALEVTSGGKRLAVPVATRVIERFKPEGAGG
jgi:hypothetical protein